MSEFGDLDTGHENYDVDHGHEASGNEHDHLNDFNAYGNDHSSDLDAHFAQGHEVESDTPYSHFQEQDYTEADVHASETDSNFNVNAVDAEHDASFSDLDHLQEHFDGGFLSAHEGGFGGYEGGHGYEGGEGELSAVSR
jgi:hypothetical protein